MIFESIFNIRSLGVCACIFSVDFFMFALQSNHLSSVTTQLKTLSEVDSLSGLSNRYYGEKTIREAVLNGSCGLFIIMDINKFKLINDKWGHFIGDEAIIKTAEALKKCARKDDVVMRLGGDEFVIFYRTEEKDPMFFANKIFEEVDRIRLTSDENYRVSVSVGYCYVEKNSTLTFDEAYKIADSKLYKSKTHGGNYMEL